MKRVIIDIDERYASVLSVTAIGGNHSSMNVLTHAIDLNKCDHIAIKHDGKVECFYRFEEEAENND